MTTFKIANRDGFKLGETAYLIGHEFGLICVSYGRHEQDALDNAADAGYLDCLRTSGADRDEYSADEWAASCSRLGKANELFWTEYLWIKTQDEATA